MPNRREWLIGMTGLLGIHSDAFSSEKPKSSDQTLFTDYFNEHEYKINITNENPLGPSPAVNEVSKIFQDSRSHRYSFNDFHFKQLVQFIAQAEHIKEDQLYVGTGLRSVIYECLARFKAKGGKRLYVTLPDYSTTAYFGTQLGLKTDRILMNKDFNVPFEELEKINNEDTIIYFSNPHLPYGTFLEQEQLEKSLKKMNKATILIDEAYIEYLPNFRNRSAVNLLKKFNNLIVLRTFSKIYGLAAHRIGYAMSSTSIRENLFPYYRKYRNISPASSFMALQSLKDQSHVEKTRKFVTKQQNTFIQNAKVPENFTFFKTNTCYIPFIFKTNKSLADIQKVRSQLKKEHDFRFWYMPNSNRYESYISIENVDKMNQSWNRILAAINQYKLIT
jgi:histidinol-phosphate aminotransferase